MPRDGSGNYTLPAGNPVTAGSIIDVDWANPTLADIAAQLNNLLTRDGLLGPLQPFKFVDGSAANPGATFALNTGTGLWRAAASAGYSYAGTTHWTSEAAKVTFGVDVYSVRLRLTSTTDASPTSTNHAFQIGLSTAPNLIIDPNEIMARDNGVVSVLRLNFEGGNVDIGDSTSTVTIPGIIVTNQVTVADALFVGHDAGALPTDPVPYIDLSTQAISDGVDVGPTVGLRMGWVEGTQDLRTGEGKAIDFCATLLAGLRSTVARIWSSKTSGNDSFKTSDLILGTSVDGIADPVERLRITTTGVTVGDLTADNVTISGALSASNFASGVYTPTLSIVTNATATTAEQCMYTRIGNVVTISGKFSIDATVSGSPVAVLMTVPIASSFTAPREGAGVVVEETGITAGASTTPGVMFIEVFQSKFQINILPRTNANLAYTFTAQYRVL